MADGRSKKVLSRDEGPAEAARLGTAIGDAPARGSAAYLRLAQAYTQVFNGNPSREDQEIVKSDLGAYTGFFMVCERGTPDEIVQYQEGMRAAFARIFNFLAMTGPELGRLQEAARAESLVNNTEGNFQ